MDPDRHRWLLRAGGIAGTLALWELLGRWQGEALLAPPSLVAVELIHILRDGKIVTALLGSLSNMIVGFALACAIGMPLGVAMGRSRVVDLAAHSWVSMLVVTSVAALVPLFIVVLGTGVVFRITIICVSAVFYITLAMYHGARGIDPRWLEVGCAFGTSPVAAFWKIMLPALYPYIVAGARIGLTQAIRGMVVAELFVIIGFGGMIHTAGLAVSTATLLALLFTLMVIGVAANEALRWIGRRLAPWHEARLLNI
ncbi:MAG: ABC transporter permease [Pseudomonadota bacterium]